MSTIGQALLKLKMNLIFVGDSLAGQLHESARCSLLRYGWKSNVKGSLKKQVEVHGVCSTGYGNLQIETFENPDGQTIGVGFCRMTETKAFEKAGQLEKLFDHADAVVFNWGLWEHGEESYERHLKATFEAFSGVLKDASKPNKLPIFKETTAQHFFSRAGTGEYEDAIGEGFKSCWGSDKKSKGPVFAGCDPRLLTRTCTPVVTPSNWRTKLANKVARDYRDVPVVPVYKYFIDRWDAHYDPNNMTEAVNRENYPGVGPVAFFPKGGQDCTHYIYSPFLYEPIWDGIFEAIEKWALKTKSVDVSSGLEPHPLISHREKLIKTTVVQLGH